MKNSLVAYALDFASFFIQKVSLEEIKNIILFGSVARGEERRESDVDIFIDLNKEDSSAEKRYFAVVKLFMQSAKYKHYWKPLGIDNPIKLSVGNAEKWKMLHPSLIANGLTLYGKYKSLTLEGKHQTFFIWENIKPNSRRVLFNKRLFGFKGKEKFYPGLLQKYGGERMGKGCILVSLEQANIFLKFFRQNKVTVKIKKVISY